MLPTPDDARTSGAMRGPSGPSLPPLLLGYLAQRAEDARAVESGRRTVRRIAAWLAGATLWGVLKIVLSGRRAPADFVVVGAVLAFGLVVVLPLALLLRRREARRLAARAHADDGAPAGDGTRREVR